jgi:hypothetical protein
MKAVDLINSIGGRKAAACLSALIVAVVACLIKGDVPAGLADILKYIVTTYVAANVGADVVAAVAVKTSSPDAPPPIVVAAPPHADNSEVLAQIATSVAATQNGMSYVISQMAPRQQQ